LIVPDRSPHLETVLKRQIRRLSFRIEKLQRTGAMYSNVRLGIVLVGIVLIAACFQLSSSIPGWIATAFAAASFCTALYCHGRVRDSINRHRILLRLRTAQVARINLDWEHIPPAPPETPLVDHPFGLDLDITGERSLHQLIDAAISIEGSRKLRSWLLQTEPDLDGILNKQSLVQELTPLTVFRHKLIASGARESESAGERLDTRAILAWFQWRGSHEYAARWMLPLFLLAAANLAVCSLAVFGAIPQYFLVAFFVYLSPLLFLQGQISKAFRDAVNLETALDRLQTVFSHLEKYGYHNTPNLAELCGPFVDRRNRPSTQLRQIGRIVSAISVRSNPVVWLFLNGLLPWDICFVRRLDRCRESISLLLPAWLDVLTEVEALGSLADFAYLNRDYSYPELEAASGQRQEEKREGAAPLRFSAVNLAHPLIHQVTRVCNSISFDGERRIALITGSNMAGKSSFLRTIGVNLCLAYAGAPVCAAGVRTGLFRIFACMRVNDSLTEGFSFFYAEVKRLKMLLSRVETDHSLPVFFLLDEIFRGTNNQERFIGSRAFIRALAEHSALGAVATHDLELARLAEENRAITNFHFREEVDGGRMIFDYRLRPGPCPTTNALKIMAMAGLPV